MMNKVYLFTLLPILVSAQMQITAQESVSQTLKPDVLRAQLSFEEHSKKSDEIKYHLNSIVSEVKKFDSKGKMCRGGGYNLSPYYNYKDQKQEFGGYNAYLNFTCEFETIEQYNTLNSALDKVLASQSKRSLGALSWGVSDKIHEQTQQNLRSAMISKTITQATDFSKSTGMKCEVNTINFGGYVQPIPMRVNKSMMLMEMASAPTESPIENDEENKLEATVTYICQ
ncbi:MAG: SIMPL domain-containing protein [Sulfuricurvum sp.]|uniref:SIMPL domain-containing protein n=1 Tax=Sulfuricurvum sp. TaxID=2025608 RepID=UPI0026190F33|nr:SIMPL domain-containing protein [Sulfuricurvum sp.]MDD2828836.1 SIMPL domain-containing protein [Sulfuricurvum sp.]MDD4948705.1 SIMPL domain-containing protein [Sulfuricurvum sp.]